jgi:hypothetical protein
VNGFSFVKNSTKYYDDCSSILAHMILKEIAPQRHISYKPISYQAEDRPIVPTSYGTMMVSLAFDSLSYLIQSFYEVLV